MNTCGAAAIRANAAWLVRIISMFVSTSPSRNFFTSAPAEKNLALALWTSTTRVALASASSTAVAKSLITWRSYELAGGLSIVTKPTAPSASNETAVTRGPPRPPT